MNRNDKRKEINGKYKSKIIAADAEHKKKLSKKFFFSFFVIWHIESTVIICVFDVMRFNSIISLINIDYMYNVYIPFRLHTAK